MAGAEASRSNRRARQLIGISIVVVVLTSIAGCFGLARIVIGNGAAALITSLYGFAVAWGGFWSIRDMRTFEPFVDQRAQFELTEQRQKAERDELRCVAEILRSNPETARRYEEFKLATRPSLLDPHKPGRQFPWP
ncbi:hypothetical protein [Burkholderia lata]|uniref:hypothetical protein n=1 Tax=Burkholderia lata (strain ATCC 17760 / DSM 23089 / LMG 22485 / NCIMB 9086 / R18194 / 383) TaxID=482957 RepID=UPI001583B7D9|nr:hypothetical protein [Burkholderia lata]